MNGARPARAVLIAGPTASGKSRLAIERAEASGGAIVNADSMQVYDGLRVLTARPSDEDMARAPHHLFGHVPPATRYSVGHWLADMTRLLPGLTARHRTIVFVGGTGLYFEALLKGLQQMPPVPAEALRDAAREIEGLGAGGRRALLMARDPKMAARLATPDPQRVKRALAVLASTGRSLADWQDAPATPLLMGWRIEKLVLAPPRDILRARIATRFGEMLEEGAVEEVRALLALRLDPSLPAMKAIGVREIAAWLAGEISREEAVARAIAATRQYAKRQLTWARNRMADWEWIEQ